MSQFRYCVSDLASFIIEIPWDRQQSDLSEKGKILFNRKTARDILNHNKTLQSIYLLRPELRGEKFEPTDVDAEQFLLWAAVYGRKEYIGINIDADFYAYLTRPTGIYLSRLEMYASKLHERALNSRFASIDDNHFWYFVHGIHEFNLEIFVSRRELEYLSAKVLVADPDGTQFTLMDSVLHAVAGEAAAVYNLSTAQGRRVFKSPEVSYRMQSLAPWLHTSRHRKAAGLPGVNLIGYAQGVLELAKISDRWQPRS